MNKDFEKEYKKMIEEDPPELWGRIEKMVDAAIAEGADAVQEAAADTDGTGEKDAAEMALAAGVAEVLGEAEQKTEANSEENELQSGTDGEEKSDVSGGEDNDETKGVIAAAFGGSASDKTADVKEEAGKKKKVFNWRRWVLPAAALLCVAIMIPVVIMINRDRTNRTKSADSAMTAMDNSVASADSEMADASTEAPMEAAEDVQSARGNEQEAFLAPQNKDDRKTVQPENGDLSVEVVTEAAGESAPEGEEEESDDEIYIEEDDEDYDDEDDWDEDEEEEEEEELVNAYIYITIDEDTPASVIDEIAAQFGLTNLGYDEEYDEYHLAVPNAMTEEALDDLVDAIDENENVWSVYWDYVEG
ncbi:MAG: hypothetical protein IKO11_06935 [Lachnospiraceae bacterium]|nr:hypothetical protein [Lachnospiraceae bacterium]